MLDRLDYLPKPIANRIYKKLCKEKEYNNFKAIVSEVCFLEYFLNKGFQIEYEPKLGKKTPDIKLQKKNQLYMQKLKDFL